MPRLRLSLTIPGDVALAAYEAGALAALIVAAQELGEDVLVIDSIASAAAGSTTGLLAARALLEGTDPMALLASAWEEPISHKTSGGVPSARSQEEPIWLSLALSTPDRAGRTRHGFTRADWYIVTLTDSVTPDEYVAYADAVIAAGSDAGGSPDVPHGQPGDDRPCEGTGHLGLPEDGLFWYTHGGTVDNEPLNRAIDLAESVGSDDERLYLAINPDPAFPTRSLSDTWENDAPSIYEALGRLEEVGAHSARIGSALDEALEAVRRRRATIESAARRILAEREADHSDDYASLLATVVQSSSRATGRRPVPVEVISPSIDPSVADPPSQQLVGTFFNHFGGHFDSTLRQSDFCLGYRNMGYWLEHRLCSYLPYLNLSAALETVERAYDAIGWGSAPSFRTEPAAGRLALHADRAMAHDLIVRES